MYKKFSDLLQQRGLRAADVSRGTGINQTVFSEWKKGKSQPKTDKLQLIADYFDVPLEYFTGKKEQKNTPPDNKRSAAIQFVENMTDDEFAQYLSIVKSIYQDKFPG